MNPAWLELLSHLEMLAGFAASVALVLVFARLQLLAPTAATRLGLVTSGLELILWLVFGTLWLIGLIQVAPLPEWAARIWAIPHFVSILWSASIVAFSASLLALAFTLHRGIHPAGPEVASPPTLGPKPAEGPPDPQSPRDGDR